MLTSWSYSEMLDRHLELLTCSVTYSKFIFLILHMQKLNVLLSEKKQHVLHVKSHMFIA